MNTTTDTAVTEYLAGIKSELADLPDTEVEEILEDIGQHVSEVAGELGEEVSVGALTERLGTPEQYASELRAAAGYPPATAVRPPWSDRLVARIALWSLIIGTLVAFVTGLAMTPYRGASPVGAVVIFGPLLALGLILIVTGATTVATVGELPEARAFAHTGRHILAALPDRVVGYLRSLRPGWWLLRIAVLAGAVLVALQRNINDNYGLLPLLALVVLLWFGSKTRADRRWRGIVIAANAFTAGLGIALLSWVFSTPGIGYATSTYVIPEDTSLHGDGRYIDNVYGFGPDGKPFTEFYLYDQNGQPITQLVTHCEGRYTQTGQTNKFPLPRIEYDDHGSCREVTGVPFTVAIPQPSTPPGAPPSTPPSSTPPSASTVPTK